jgi:hypothetical protein
MDSIPKEQVMTFLTWLAYEHNLHDIYEDMTAKQMQESERIFTIELGKLIESCGYNTLGELTGEAEKG